MCCPHNPYKPPAGMYAEFAALRRGRPRICGCGIPQIARRVSDFAKELNEDIEAYGIIITKYRAASTLHVNTVARLQDNAEDGKNPPLFETFVPEGKAIAAAAEFTGRGTLRQKYAYQGGYETFERLADEVAETAGI